MILMFTAELIRMKQWRGGGYLPPPPIPALLVLQIKSWGIRRLGVGIKVCCPSGPFWGKGPYPTCFVSPPMPSVVQGPL